MYIYNKLPALVPNTIFFFLNNKETHAILFQRNIHTHAILFQQNIHINLCSDKLEPTGSLAHRIYTCFLLSLVHTPHIGKRYYTNISYQV